MSSVSPLVSVVIPVYNGETFLAAAVASVCAQTWHRLEIVVVDDGSTDGTADVMARLGSAIRAGSLPRCGPAAARNRGLTLARGEVIAFLDADDLWPSDKVQVQVERLLEQPLVDVVLGRTQLIATAGGPVSQGHPVPHPVVTVHLGAAVFRRRAFQRVGLFDERLRYSEDHDWFLRAREQGVAMAVVDQVTLLYRRHSGNMTRDPDHQGYQLARVLKASLDRRRAHGAGVAQPLPRITEMGETRRGDGERRGDGHAATH